MKAPPHQEFKAEKSIAALKKLTAPQAKVRRDGQVTSIPASGIVAGDILALKAGDLGAADARLLEAASLRCIESALTGDGVNDAPAIKEGQHDMNGPSPKQGSMMVPNTMRPRSAAPVRRPGRLGQETRRVWAILSLAVKTFFRIDGAQWAGAFAFNAFFSLFPVLILLVTIASSFIDRDRAGTEVIAYMESYVPISGEMQRYIFDAIAGVIQAREQAGAVALLLLVWTALYCFTTLICATNRAWGTEVYSWWRLPLKSLMLLGVTAGAVLLGMAAPVLAKMAKDWLFPVNDFRSWVYALGSFVIPLLAVFFGLSLFYRLAPRRPTQFTEVWAAALCATALLQAAESLFVIYLKNFATLNAVYGAFGGIMALLLWIYLSGCIFIFGACLCAAQAEGRSAPAETTMALNKRN